MVVIFVVYFYTHNWILLILMKIPTYFQHYNIIKVLLFYIVYLHFYWHLRIRMGFEIACRGNTFNNSFIDKNVLLYKTYKKVHSVIICVLLSLCNTPRVGIFSAILR